MTDPWGTWLTSPSLASRAALFKLLHGGGCCLLVSFKISLSCAYVSSCLLKSVLWGQDLLLRCGRWMQTHLGICLLLPSRLRWQSRVSPSPSLSSISHTTWASQGDFLGKTVLNWQLLSEFTLIFLFSVGRSFSPSWLIAGRQSPMNSFNGIFAKTVLCVCLFGFFLKGMPHLLRYLCDL